LEDFAGLGLSDAGGAVYLLTEDEWDRPVGGLPS